ncbi:nitronate monooxygenase [Egibacter rhizosphaerae]|uniref:Nitronate monooxygenase n=2 Tax=Egibacter rhizosphaerae TaxID=1670831 RepID=A0A411YLA6_9ACTN|nr:nitronate monooxygenase [Egibacter rhizosphaerae]
MGVAVSHWPLAQEVARSGGVGVVSGTAIGVVVARRLQDGDPGGHMRRALEAFPIPGVGERIIDRYFVEGGRPAGKPYKAVPAWNLTPKRPLVELTVAASFAEVFLAAEGHDGPVGVNLLHKVKLPNPATLYGAVLAGVDVAVMGAGIPRDIPAMLDRLATHDVVEMAVEVAGEKNPEDGYLRFDPRELWTDPKSGEAHEPIEVGRPNFLAIVSSATLAAALARDPVTCPDGFVVEAHVAGGHNAPPRGRLQLDDEGQPVYGAKDEVDFDKVADLGLPFWLAGGQGHPGAIADARSVGARGIQVGTAFAMCQESGISEPLRQSLLQQALAGEAKVRTDAHASPTGFPFKVAEMEGTMDDAEVYAQRERICDLGFLTHTYRREDGKLGQRCPSEPVEDYEKKGGDVAETEGRKCLCNGLLATAGFAQIHKGVTEAPIVTSGDDLVHVARFVPDGAQDYSARDVLHRLGVEVTQPA